MSSPAPFGIWNGQGHGVAVQTPPPSSVSNDTNEDGITVKPMRLKVLYTFDDQNKTNCLARWPHVLQIQTVVMDEGATIGVIELKTCIQAIVQCSPELVARMGQDYTVYAYDYSEYDNPLVGQGMLSRVLHASSPAPEAPAQQSRQLITGRVCKNILGLFANGVKETLEVKLRLVPVPTVLQNEYQNTMEKYRESNRNIPPPGFDANEWNSLIQSTPNFGRNPMPANSVQHQNPSPSLHQRDGVSMELVNQLLTPSAHDSQDGDSFDNMQMDSFTTQIQEHSFNAPSPVPIAPAPVPQSSVAVSVTAAAKKPVSRPSSRNTTKRPRKSKQNTPAVGGNTSGYEEGTEGEDTQPARKKRAKPIKANEWNAKSSFGTGADLRMVASTAGSLRLFRPIAMSPAVPNGSHLQEVPRAPTPIPKLRHTGSKNSRQQSNLRRDSFAREPSLPSSPYIRPAQIEDDVRSSIESAGPSPERQETPAETPPEIFGSSPPVMRTRPPSPTTMRSSPPCPTSPCLPPMPRMDSGFMSGTIEELFGDDNIVCPVEEEVEVVKPPKRQRNRGGKAKPEVKPGYDIFRVVTPGPVDLLPTELPSKGNVRAGKSKKNALPALQTTSRAGSVVSEDGTQTLPILKPTKPISMAKTPLSATFEQVDTETNSTRAIAIDPAIQPSQDQSQPSIAPVASMTIPNISPDQSLDQPEAVAFPDQDATKSPVKDQVADPQPSCSPTKAATTPTASQDIPIDFAEVAQRQENLSETPSISIVPASQGVELHRRPSMPAPLPPAQNPKRTFGRTASMGSLTLPQVPASDPVLPPSQLHRSQTWSEVQHPVSEAPYHPADDPNSSMHNANKERTNQEPPRPSVTENEIPYSRTANAKKAAIKQKLEAAIANGEMPPYCRNCGAIETPAWRKAWAQEVQGAPGYFEYSDEPGRVTAIMVLTRDLTNHPTSYLLIKKSLKTTENMSLFQEFVLCNPCGIWMSKYKTQRPPERWENNRFPVEKKVTEVAVRPQYHRPPSVKPPKLGSKNSEPPVTFDNNYTYGPPPGDFTGMHSYPPHPQQQLEQSDNAQTQKRSSTMTSDAASAALRRALQSSPARWNGSRHSPIDVDVDEADTTRRLLFPSPRKDGSPKVLGETTTNVVQISPTFHKGSIVDVPNKENCPPVTADGNEDDFLRLFEEELARPTTPVQKDTSQNPFKTPTRPTPSHRPITRSVSKSIRKSPSQFLAVTPSRVTPRRSPRNHNNGFVSPFTATLNQMMSEASNHAQTSPSRHAIDMGFDTLPDLPLGHRQGHLDNNFSLEDFFSTDVPMPSSPPRPFAMYEDPMTSVDMNNIDWSEFHDYSNVGMGGVEIAIHEENGEMTIKTEGERSPEKNAQDMKKDADS